MHTDAHNAPPRNKLNIFWWLGGFFLILLLLFFYQLLGPSPRIIVSPQTTYITEPLGPDGLPDYEQYVLELHRKGVTSQNNAAVLLWQAIWPGELKPPQYAAMAQELGLDEIPTEKESLIGVSRGRVTASIADWLRKREAGRPANNSATDLPSARSLDGDDPLEEVPANEHAVEQSAEEIVFQSMERPWTSEQIPPLAQWIAENRKPLDLIVEASRRPRYYSPSPSLLGNKSEFLTATSLPGIQFIRETSRCLSARAMWHLGEGRADNAWNDVLASHRIARLAAQGHTLVDQLVAIAIHQMACDRTITLLHHVGLSPEQSKTIQRDIASLDDFSGMANSIDRMERAYFLDVVTRLSRGDNESMSSEVGLEDHMTLFNYVSVDWNIVLRVGNKLYDRMAAAARLPNYAARQREFAKIDTEVAQLTSNFGPATFLAAVLSPSARGDAIAAVMAGLFLPALNAAMAAEDRANTTLDLTRLTAALAVYRAEHGAYPNQLSDLVPDVLPKLPLDLYNAKPFIYKRTDDGYLLYSAGENGQDDRGSNEIMSIFRGQPVDDFDGAESQKMSSQIPTGADDISIRVPRPAFKLPDSLP